MTAELLAGFSDARLAALVAAAEPLGMGIGGRSAVADVSGTRVFVKRVPLTELELRHFRSTANLFGLPLYYQYGIGSAGFGAWRELAAHLLTTGWVQAGRYDGFPLLHHWRVLPDTPPAGFLDEFGGIDGAVARWDGSPAVRARLEAIGRASASLVLFLEYLPRTLADDVIPEVATELERGCDFMASQRFLHLDAHFRNILTDGERLCFADFGLALSASFDLTPAESEFLANHLTYDRHYTANHLLRFHVLADEADPDQFLLAWVAGDRPPVAPEVARLLDRHAAGAVTLHDFHQRLLENKSTPYPSGELG